MGGRLEVRRKAACAGVVGGTNDELSQSRSIRFTQREWKAAGDLGAEEYGGARPHFVVRVALRELLKRRGYV